MRINKVLILLNHNLQSKVILIFESNSLSSSMDLATLFGKLQKHEIKLKKLVKNKEVDKKNKSLALKVGEGKDSDIDEDMELLVQKDS